ncbi:unnamed protein product [Nesidiocoris tenuis]|uniref:Uncharacterized protein n=1 Tax=Nesidiocoris tenuis TaxID=355587 RepID=A0A6H5HH66_9HEMI|nr:unnamed protein product [Nesidiocoris tenuis]
MIRVFKVMSFWCGHLGLGKVNCSLRSCFSPANRRCPGRALPPSTILHPTLELLSSIIERFLTVRSPPPPITDNGVRGNGIESNCESDSPGVSPNPKSSTGSRGLCIPTRSITRRDSRINTLINCNIFLYGLQKGWEIRRSMFSFDLIGIGLHVDTRRLSFRPSAVKRAPRQIREMLRQSHSRFSTANDNRTREPSSAGRSWSFCPHFTEARSVTLWRHQFSALSRQQYSMLVYQNLRRRNMESTMRRIFLPQNTSVQTSKSKNV